MSVPVRSRDERIFGGASGSGSTGLRKRDPPLPDDLGRAIKDLEERAQGGLKAGLLEEYKSLANQCYHHGCYAAAIRLYSYCIEHYHEHSHSPIEGKVDDLLIYYSNRSAAYLRSVLLAGPSLAAKDALFIINYNKERGGGWYKGYLRLADALLAQNKLHEAIDNYNTTLRLEPGCTSAQDSLRLAQRLMQAAEQGNEPGGSPKSNTYSNINFNVLDSGQNSPTRAGRPAPELAPYSEAAHGPLPDRGSPQCSPSSALPRPEETEAYIRQWRAEEGPSGATGRTATKAYSSSVAEADRAAGRAAMDGMMAAFRRRVRQDGELANRIQGEHEQAMTKGSNFNYRAAATTARRYSKGTDDIGQAISADSYNSYTYKDRVW